MNIFKKLINGVNPDDDEPFNDVFDDDEMYSNSDGDYDNGDIGDFMNNGGGYSPYSNANQGGYSPQPQQQPQQQSYHQQPPPPANNSSITVTAGGNMQYSTELKVIKPGEYNNVREIADHLINRRTVFLNLEDTNKETARRLIDFLTGVAYAIEGHLERVSERTFVIAPKNVVITPEQIKAESNKNNNMDNSIY